MYDRQIYYIQWRLFSHSLLNSLNNRSAARFCRILLVMLKIEKYGQIQFYSWKQFEENMFNFAVSTVPVGSLGARASTGTVITTVSPINIYIWRVDINLHKKYSTQHPYLIISIITILSSH